MKILQISSKKAFRPPQEKLLFLFVFIAGAASAARYTYAQGQYPNPIGVTSFITLVVRITKEVAEVALVLAVIAIIFAGLKFVLAASSGNEAELTKARQIFWWVLLGTGLIVGAYAIASAVCNFFLKAGC